MTERTELSGETHVDRLDLAEVAPVDNRFVGRGGELEQISRGLDEALAGRGRLFLLMGEPGIGKTSLCDEVTASATRRGIPVLWGRSWEAGGAPAYWPWMDVLAGLSRQMDDATLRAALDDDGAPLVAELIPEIRQRLGPLPATAPPPADEARFRLWRTVFALVRRAAAPRGLVLVFDDLHSADRSSLLLVYALARELRSLHVVLIATCRDVEARLNPEASELISRVGREGVTLNLARLDRAAASALLRRRAERLEANVEAQIFDSSQGNPLFLVEMLRLLGDEGPASIAAGVVPSGVRDVIRQRLDRVAGDARSLLDLAAVAGDEIQPALLAAASGRDPTWVSGRITEAIRAGVFAERAGRPRFSHALVREVLYRDLADHERRALHATIGRAIEHLHSVDAELPLMELAHHGLEGPPEDLSRAVDFALRAAGRPAALTAPEEAITLLERAVTALESSGNPPTLRARVLLALAEARIRCGDVVEGKSLCCDVATLARRLDDPELLANAALTYGRVFTFAVVDPVMVDLLESALAALPPGDSPLRARLLARLGSALQPSTNVDEPVRVVREAIATARRLGDRRALLETIYDGLSALMDVVDPLDRLALNLEVETLATALGNREQLLRTHARLAVDYLALGQFPEADARIEAFETLGRELRASWILWRAPLFRAVRAATHGRFAEAEEHEARARELARGVRDPQSERALILYREGLLRMAERHDEMPALDALARRERSGFHNGLAWQAIASAFMFARLENAEQARFHVDLIQNEMLPPNNNLFAMGGLGEPVAFAGSADLAGRLYQSLLPWADQCVMLGMAQMQWEGPVARLLALLSARLKRWDDAVGHFEDALARLRHLGARPLLARTHYEFGRTLWQIGGPGDADRARTLLASAREIALELGMPGLIRLVDLRLGEWGLVSPGVVELAANALSRHDANAKQRSPQPPFSLSMTLEGEYWTLTGQGGSTLRLKDSLGLQYLARLLAEPGREIHVLDLVAAGSAGSATGADDQAVDRGDAGELLDDEARAEYRRRLEDLRDTLAEAESFGDTARAARAREEIDFLAAELGRAVGLGGRVRRAGSAAERARSAVQRRIKNAIVRIGEAAPELAPVLARTIRTGNFCVYRPDSP